MIFHLLGVASFVITDFFDGICTILPELVNLIYYGGLLHEFHIFLKRLR